MRHRNEVRLERRDRDAKRSLVPTPSEVHQTLVLLWQAEYRRIPDGDLAAEITYVQREALEMKEAADKDRQQLLDYRLTILEDEAARRRRLAAKGGPLYKAQPSVSADRI